MILSAVSNVVSKVWQVIDAGFTAILNCLLVPLSLLYTAISHALGDRWQLSDVVHGVYYLWWSRKEQSLKSPLGLISGCSRSSVFWFTVVAIPLIFAALLKVVTTSAQKNKSDADILEVVEVVDENKK